MRTARRREPIAEPVCSDAAKFIFFDLETTGLSSRSCRIIEIAGLRVAKRGVPCGSFHALIRIDAPVPPFIRRLTGITDEMLADGDPIEEALPRFAAFVEDLPLVAYNIAFDMSFLRAEGQRLGLRMTNTPVCALQVARAKLPGLADHKLRTVARHFGIVAEQSHRALDDCEMGLQVFAELMRG